MVTNYSFTLSFPSSKQIILGSDKSRQRNVLSLQEKVI